MRALKITLILAVLFASLTSCVKQDLNEDDLLDGTDTELTTPPTGGNGQDE